MKIKSLCWILPLFIAMALLSACTDEVEMPTPVPVIVEPTIAPTATPLPTLVNEPGTPVEETLPSAQMNEPGQSEVANLLAESLGLQPNVDIAMGLEGIYALPVTVPGNSEPFMVAHTIGIRSFDPLQTHVIALFKQTAGTWQEMARLELVDPNLDETGSSTSENSTAQTNPSDTTDQPALAAVDYLGAGSVSQVQIDADHLWLTVEGGVGAHSGVFNLLRYSEGTIQVEATGFNSSPGVAQLRDLNGDGIQELILDASDYYVFCYACGVRFVQYIAMRWDGERMVSIDLVPLPDSAAPALRQLNEQAIDLAEAGLWKDALAKIAANDDSQLVASDETFLWNRAMIQLTGEARRQQAETEEMAYPLLDKVFYGDFAAALDGMRGFEANSIFSLQSPLIIGTAAEGNEQQLVDRLLLATEQGSEQALEAHNRAAAHFLRGWAYYLIGDQPAAIASIKAANELEPADQLIQECLDFVENQ